MPPTDNKKWTILDKVFAHFEMWRLYTVIWVGLVGVIGAVLANDGLPSLDVWLVVFGVTIMGWIGGLYLSDILDRNLDRIQKPHRPIPSGRVSVLEAFVVGLVFALTGIILIVWKLTLHNLFVAVVVALLVFVHAYVTKSRGLMGHMNRGLMTVTAFVFGVVCIDQSLMVIPWMVWMFSVVFFLHDMNSNIVGAVRDMQGDRLGGYYTIPVRYGLQKTWLISLALTSLWWCIAVGWMLWMQKVNTPFLFMIFIDLIVLCAMYLYYYNSMQSYTREKGLRFHEFFVIERIVFASAILFGLIEFNIALLIAVGSLVVTALAQKGLRKRYEFEEIGEWVD